MRFLKFRSESCNLSFLDSAANHQEWFSVQRPFFGKLFGKAIAMGAAHQLQLDR